MEKSGVSARRGKQRGACEGGDGGKPPRVADGGGKVKIWNLADDLFGGV